MAFFIPGRLQCDITQHYFFDASYSVIQCKSHFIVVATSTCCITEIILWNLFKASKCQNFVNLRKLQSIKLNHEIHHNQGHFDVQSTFKVKRGRGFSAEKMFVMMLNWTNVFSLDLLDGNSHLLYHCIHIYNPSSKKLGGFVKCK